MARRKKYGVTMIDTDLPEQIDNTQLQSDANEFKEAFDAPIEPITTIEEIITEPPIIEKDELKVTETSENKMYTVVVKFDKLAVQVEYEVQATGQKDKMVAANKELRLMQGRFYLIPVEPFGLDSDDFGNLKVLSDMAKLIDVRYIKDGKACVLPLRHNVSLKDGMRLCVIW